MTDRLYLSISVKYKASITSFFSVATSVLAPDPAYVLARRSCPCSPLLPVPPSKLCHFSLPYVTVHPMLVVPPLSRTYTQHSPVLTYEPANHQGNSQQPSLFVIGISLTTSSQPSSWKDDVRTSAILMLPWKTFCSASVYLTSPKGFGFHFIYTSTRLRFLFLYAIDSGIFNRLQNLS
ncbi:hypothetical protein PIB30_014351 [Stylosanthes scabra]|uniref:Uncharacterized protein n=1 Tax=Stylosanthes scabra TaxID=79078 RepID=A0ABU6S634_9FABA|nr:hypothetical protein [Stylosanthes scabra]